MDKGDFMVQELKKAYTKGSFKELNLKLDEFGVEPFSNTFTLEEIGYILGITRERVRQIESSAIKKLRHPTINRKFREYIAYTVEQDTCSLID